MTQIWVVRHGPTEWSASGRHTGRADLPLTPEGEQEARGLAPTLAAAAQQRPFDAVLTSPLQRARRTAELAGFPAAAVEPLAVEWDYGDVEGRTRQEIREQVPDWSPWTHQQMPGGEHLDDVVRRAEALLARLGVLAEAHLDPAHGGFGGADLADDGRRVLLFAHGHFLRVLAARYLGQPATLAGHLQLDPATISVLAPDRGDPMVLRWNS